MGQGKTVKHTSRAINTLCLLGIASVGLSGCFELGRNLQKVVSTDPSTVTYVPVPTYAPALLYTNGEVRSLATKNGHLFMGGAFTYVGPYTRSAPSVDLDSGKITTPSIRFPTQVVEPDGNGGYYVGGDRYMYDGSGGSFYNAGFTHVLADGGVDTAFSAAAYVNGGQVYAIKKSGNVVYLAGNFVQVGGQDRKYLAAVDANTGALLPFYANLSVGTSYYARALEVVGSTLYVGGDINSVQPGGGALPWATVTHLLAVDASTGATLQWAPASIDAPISSLKALGNKLYVGGSFTTIQASSRNRLAVYDVSTPSAPVLLSSDPLPASFYKVMGISVAPGRVLLSGADTSAPVGQGYGAAAALNSASDAVLWRTVGLGKSGTTITLNPVATNADFSRIVIGINNHDLMDVQQLDPLTGAVSDLSFGDFKRMRVMNKTGLGYGTQKINSLAFMGSRLIVGGQFQSIVMDRVGAAEINVDTNVPTPWDPYLTSGQVNSIALADDQVFLGGSFSSLNANTTPVVRSNIAAVAYGTGTVTSWDPGTGTDGSIDKLLVHNGVLGAVGSFSTAGGLSRNGIAIFDAVDGDVDPALDPASMLSCAITATAADGDDLFVASCASGSPAIIKLSISGSGFPGIITLNSPAYGLTLTNQHLFAMGAFTLVNNSVAKPHMLKVDRFSGQMVSFPVNGFPSGPAALYVNPTGRLFMGTTTGTQNTFTPGPPWYQATTGGVVDSVTGYPQNWLYLGISGGSGIRQFISIGKTTYIAGSFTSGYGSFNYQSYSFDAPNIMTLYEDVNGWFYAPKP